MIDNVRSLSGLFYALEIPMHEKHYVLTMPSFARGTKAKRICTESHRKLELRDM